MRNLEQHTVNSLAYITTQRIANIDTIPTELYYTTSDIEQALTLVEWRRQHYTGTGAARGMFDSEAEIPSGDDARVSKAQNRLQLQVNAPC